MMQTNPTDDFLKAVDYWPPNIGYDTFCGINRVKYPQDKNDSDELLKHVVESWKFTAEQHRLDLPVAKALRCTPCSDHEKCYLVSYKKSDSDTESATIHGTIDKVDAEYDVDETPGEKETTISIRINGVNFETKKEYSLYLSINRYPEKTSYCKLKN